MLEEVKVNELFDLKAKGYFKDGVGPGTHQLSDFGKKQFDDLVKSLPAKAQVMVAMMIDTAEKTDAEVKAFMK